MAIEADPMDARPYGNRAQCQIELGKYEEAYSDSCKAIELDPSVTKVRFSVLQFKVCSTTHEKSLVWNT
jgi:hypothetical protein